MIKESVMKKFLSAVLALAIICCMALTLVSCAEKIDKGIYKATDGATIEVKSGKIIMKEDGVPETVYKYEIVEDESGNKSIVLEVSYKSDNDAYDDFEDTITHPFSSEDGKIVVGGKTYIKQ